MREIPILFSTPMVQVILEGRKTMTRRVIKPQPPVEAVYSYISEELISEKLTERFVTFADSTGKTLSPQVMIPYQPGDILWVRETWCDWGGNYIYRADGEEFSDPCEAPGGGYPASCRSYPGCEGCMAQGQKYIWRPSIHMPKEAARIFLRITDVRVERLQEITYDDCLREGMWNYGTDVDTLAAFQELWQTLYAKRGYGWETNCWVWVLEFERV
jgi:hypothetical protein